MSSDWKNIYKRIERVGNGSYATVYKSKEIKTGNIVAVKKYLSKYSDLGLAPDILREMAILKLSDHPNIVKMISYDNISFIRVALPCYEYTLKKYLTGVTLTVDNIKNISYQLLSGLHYLNSYSIVHRDIKPQNIMVNENNEIVFIDFGLGKKMNVEKNTHEVVTLWYRPPEILLGGDYSYNIDIWSIGCIVGEMLTGNPLLSGDSEIDQLYTIFQMFGTPDESTWEGISQLGEYKPCFPKFDSSFDKDFSKYDNVLVDLLRKLLTMNPTKRIFCTDALNHAFFNTKRTKKINDEFFDNMVSQEVFTIKNYITDDITDKTRNVLIDWLFEVCEEFDVGMFSYIRSQGILDRFLSNKTLPLKSLQLLGITSLWISCKIEEMCSPTSSDMVYICDNTYDRDDIVDMEKKILRKLDLDVYFPTTIDYLSLFSKRLNLSSDQKKEVEYILLIILYNIDLMKYHPSILTLCSCLYVLDLPEAIKKSKKKIKLNNNYYEDMDKTEKCMNEMKLYLNNLKNTKKLKDLNSVKSCKRYKKFINY